MSDVVDETIRRLSDVISDAALEARRRRNAERLAEQGLRWATVWSRTDDRLILSLLDMHKPDGGVCVGCMGRELEDAPPDWPCRTFILIEEGP